MRPETYEPTDAAALRMENDLLTAENAVLRARLSDAGRVAEKAQAKAVNKAVKAALADGAGPVVGDHELAELKKARNDLRWFIGRLANSRVGWVLRRWEGFRVLEDRWTRE